MGEFDVIISERAKRDFLAIRKSGDQASIKKIDKIINELYVHPHKGVGNPEQLKYELSGLWSRQINKKDRMIYKIEDETVTVTVISSKGHYSDK